MQPRSTTTLLNVEDYDASVRFYRTLGFDVAQEARDEARGVAWCLLTCGGLRLMLNRSSRADSGQRRGRPDYGDAVLYLYVDDAAAAWAELQAAGVPGRHVGPQDYGLDEVWLRDPDGYHVVVASDVE